MFEIEHEKTIGIKKDRTYNTGKPNNLITTCYGTKHEIINKDGVIQGVGSFLGHRKINTFLPSKW